jgi:hypothetical protein
VNNQLMRRALLVAGGLLLYIGPAPALPYLTDHSLVQAVVGQDNPYKVYDKTLSCATSCSSTSLSHAQSQGVSVNETILFDGQAQDSGDLGFGQIHLSSSTHALGGVAFGFSTTDLSFGDGLHVSTTGGAPANVKIVMTLEGNVAGVFNNSMVEYYASVFGMFEVASETGLDEQLSEQVCVQLNSGADCSNSTPGTRTAIVTLMPGVDYSITGSLNESSSTSGYTDLFPCSGGDGLCQANYLASTTVSFEDTASFYIVPLSSDVLVITDSGVSYEARPSSIPEPSAILVFACALVCLLNLHKCRETRPFAGSRGTSRMFSDRGLARPQWRRYGIDVICRSCFRAASLPDSSRSIKANGNEIF